MNKAFCCPISGRRVPFKVGKYVVDVAAFESVVMPLLRVDKDSDAEVLRRRFVVLFERVFTF